MEISVALISKIEPMEPTVNLTTRVKPQIRDSLVALAKKDGNRSISNYLAIVLEKHVERKVGRQGK
jgi:hypothetical protein